MLSLRKLGICIYQVSVPTQLFCMLVYMAA